MSAEFVITNPPVKRKRKIDGTYMTITEDKDWVQNEYVWEFTDGGCLKNHDSGTYYTDDSLTIVISGGRIQSITETIE